MAASDVSSLLERLGRVDTTSLVDAERALGVLPGSIRPLRPGLRFVGRAVTVEAERLAAFHAVSDRSRSGEADVRRGGDETA